MVKRHENIREEKQQNNNVKIKEMGITAPTTDH